jgi:hypothetical protein
MDAYPIRVLRCEIRHSTAPPPLSPIAGVGRRRRFSKVLEEKLVREWQH